MQMLGLKNYIIAKISPLVMRQPLKSQK